MIALTTVPSVNSVLGGNAPVGYDKFVLSPFTMDPVGQTVTATVRMTSTASPAMQAVIGSLTVSVPASELVIQVPQLNFLRRVALNGAQNSAVLAQIEAALAQLENGLISLGVVAGTRSAGS